MPHSQSSAQRGRVRLARGASPWLLPTVATAAVSLARSTTAYRYLILSRGFPAIGAHTLRLVFVRPAGRLADVDAFVVLR